MEPRPTTSNGHEWSIERRETLRRLARSLGLLLAAPLITLRFLQTTINAATETANGEHMNQLSPTADDPFRLPRHVFPVRYELQLEPDLARAAFHGYATI